jgi:adenosylcobinamide kinase/adenosylcobinamide-phosphate guanylyltransferase
VLDARHGAGGSVLYDVAAADARLLYATDTGSLPEATVSAVRGAAFDVVLMEETFGSHLSHGSDHLDLATFPDQLRRLRAVGAVTDDTDVVAVHLSHHNPPGDELGRRLSAWGARAAQDGARLHAGTGPARVGTLPRRTLVVGGARSGKSSEAERLLAAEPEVVYVATAYPAGDEEEWDRRIADHQARRPAHWSTVETCDVVGLLRHGGAALLVDCLTLWLTRVLDAHDAWDEDSWAQGADKAVQVEIDELVAAWRATSRRVVAVTNEVGQGVVPDTAAGRRFRDLMGRLNAAVAAETEDVRWCVAGRVVSL